MTISEQLSRETRELTFDTLPDVVVHESKRRLLDTLACGIAGFDSPPSRALQALFKETGGPAEATLYGSGFRTSAMNAALANGVMVRFSEAMDLSLESANGVTFHGHPGEVIPSILAVGERQHSSGKDIITAIVLGYQLLNRLSYAMGGGRAIEHNGWKNEIRAGLIVPLVVGKLMGLTEQQLVNAVGISGCFSSGLGLLDHGSEEVTMSRDLRFPHHAYQAILAALMAQKGFEGPSRVYEGHNGFNEVISRGKIDLALLSQSDGEFNILYTWTKAYPVNIRLLGLTEILRGMVRDHHLTPERVARIRIRTTQRVLEGMGNPGTHRYPQTKQTADQSAYYVAALVIADGTVRLGLDQFTAERMRDPKLRAVIDKIELIAVPEWKTDDAPTEVEITTVDGATHSGRVDHPKGHVRNPMTDHELRDKFRGMASRLMDEAKIKKVFAAIDGLEELKDISKLTSTLVVA